MQRKAFQVQVELDIQAITCPGVWLCPAGKISLQLYMLDSCIQTVNADPVFPILCHEKFIFYKTFYDAQRLSELQKLLNKECLYIEFIQWQTCELGTVLASFQTNLCELLYPSVHEGAIPGVDIDLLMEPSPNYPGLIAPKIEVSTKTVIEDTVCDGKKESAFVVNPKVIQSKGGSMSRSSCIHQRKVCHSAGYNRSRKRFPKLTKTGKPVFTYRKVEDDLLSRKPQGLGPVAKEICNCRSLQNKNDLVLRTFTEGCKKNSGYYQFPKTKTSAWSKTNLLSKVTNCLCSSGHDYRQCPVCSKYTYYFEDNNARKKSPCGPCQRAMQVQGRKSPCEGTGNARVVRCRCMQDGVDDADSYNKKSCPKSRRSLAEKLHQRLAQTLDSCAETLQFDGCRNDSFSDSQGLSPIYERNNSDIECACPETNIGEFYRKFYRQARSKLNCDEYITPCCI